MSEQGNNKKNKITIILVVVAFTSPLILSWFIFNHTNFLEMRGMSNLGELIEPPRPIDDLSLIDPLNADRKESLHGKWSMVYLAKTCDKACMDNVYRMRQIHIAMDKHSLRVQKVLFLTQQGTTELSGLFNDFAGQQVINTDLINTSALLDKFRLTSTDKPLQAGRIYIVDPMGNLMMSFQPDANPRDIMKDLHKLLRASRIG
jgi:cytochrome oxidase Cu insertion factor (SCO1/SenC/PrrC family)